MHLSWIDYLILCLYFAFVIGIGFVLKKRVKSGEDFLMSGRSIPLWISSLAFISANMGAQEVIGMSASGAKYGMMTAHFYWLGAIPAMVFLGLFMMPFYYGSRARSVPEYLRLRFDEKTRGLNAVAFAAMTVFSSGISLYALAILLEALLGWNFGLSVVVSAAIVTAYTFTGGLTSAIYNEVLQFFLIVFGIAPLVYLGLEHTGGWAGMMANLPQPMTHVWKDLDHTGNNPMGTPFFSLVMGLGFVLSFGYWCTDFLVVQRAMVAHNLSAARRTPILAAVPKMLLPFVVVVPGLIIMALGSVADAPHLPLKADGRPDFDMALPTLLGAFYPPGLLGLGLTALMASFMSGMAGNVTAFNSVWTYDIYQAYLNPKATDRQCLRMGKASTVVGVLLSLAIAYLARSFNNIMDLLQLVFGFVNAPLFATFLLGMFWKRATGHGAFWGLLSGTVGAALAHGSSVAEGKGGWLPFGPLRQYPSAMAQALDIAIFSFLCCLVVTLVVSLFTKPKADKEMVGLVYGLTEKVAEEEPNWYLRPWPLAIGVLLATAFLNFALR